MPVSVYAPLGSSPLAAAVVRILTTLDALDKVTIGPAVFHDERITLTCAPEGKLIKLVVPITNGCRVFLIEYGLGAQTVLQSPADVAAIILERLRNIKLPPDRALVEPSRRRYSRPSPLITSRLRKLSARPTFPGVAPTAVSQPTPPTAPPITPATLTAATVLECARTLADQDGCVEGLVPKLVAHLGGNLESMKTVVNELITSGQLEFKGPAAVIERYQWYQLIAHRHPTSPM